MEPFDDPLAAQFARFREDTLASVRPEGAASARHLYEERHRTRVLTVVVAGVIAAVITAGGGFALAHRGAATLPAGHPSASASTTDAPSPVTAPSTLPAGVLGGGGPSDSPSATVSTPPANVRVASVTAIGVNTLWAIGNAPCTGHAWQVCPVVLTSHDAGHTWSPLPAPGTAPYLGEIRFANNKDGWVIARDGIHDHEPTDGWGVLYATHDGGSSWHEITTIRHVTHVEASAGVVWVTAANTGFLFTAPVSSNSFVKLAITPGDALVVHGKYSYTYPTTWAPDQSGVPTLTLVHSNGTTTANPLPCPADTTVDLAMSADGDTRLVLVCGQARTGTDQDKTAFSSVDGGVTWTSLGTPDRAGRITSIATCTAGTFLAGEGMPVRATRDGGASWSSVLSAPAEGGYTYIGFTDDKHGFALAAGPSDQEIRMTVDGGHSWSTYRFDNS